MKIINIFSGDVVFEEERPLPNEEYLIQYIKELETELMERSITQKSAGA